MVEFELEFARRQATDVDPVPGGIAVRHRDFPASHNNNRLLITEQADPAAVLDAADRVLTDLEHRLVTVYDDEFGTAFAGVATAAGYDHVPLVAMAYTGDAPPPPAVPVEAVDVATLLPSLRREWRQLLPAGADGRIEQLARRVTARLNGAERVDFIAVLDDARQVLARVDLYLQDGVAQLEYVDTAPGHRGHGYARAVVHEALRRARAAKCGLIFLFAEERDWPSRWYGRLGFTKVGMIHEFTRTPGG
jgi:GNAT superfamily N-acetyltransferase